MAYRFIVAGIKHGGTKEFARLLTLAGIPCHELKDKQLSFDHALYAKDGAYSYMFAGHLVHANLTVRQRIIYDSIVSDETLAIFIVKNPITTILKLRTSPISYDEKVILAHYGVDVDVFDTEIDRAVSYYVAWFWMTYQIYMDSAFAACWRLEHMTAEDFEEIAIKLMYPVKRIKLPKLQMKIPNVYIKNRMLQREFDRIMGFLGY